ncbi:hypothetical protein ACMC56_00760 [Campylobacterota bacterium DY0563]
MKKILLVLFIIGSLFELSAKKVALSDLNFINTPEQVIREYFDIIENMKITDRTIDDNSMQKMYKLMDITGTPDKATKYVVIRKLSRPATYLSKELRAFKMFKIDKLVDTSTNLKIDLISYRRANSLICDIYYTYFKFQEKEYKKQFKKEYGKDIISTNSKVSLGMKEVKKDVYKWVLY